MARLFVPTGFEASKVSPDLYLFLLKELSDYYVLLEFHSKGRDQRQIDIAVLGPYGVDVVEVKAKVGGAVVASSNGPWHIHRDDGVVEELPLNGSAQENPYDQAYNTAADLERWLEAELDIRTKVFPLVLIPQHRPDNNVRNRKYVWGANGLKRFGSSLRSWRDYKDIPSSLTSDHWERIVKALELLELTAVNAAPAKADVPDKTEPLIGRAARVSAPEHQSSSVAKTTGVAPSPSSSHRQSDEYPQAQVTRVRDSTRRTPWTNMLLGTAAAVLLGFAWFAFAPDSGRSVTPVTPLATTPPAQEPAAEVVPPAEPEPTSVPVAVNVTTTDDGSSEILPEGTSCPTSHPIKGNINAKGEQIFHVEGQSYYEVTNPEVCFASNEAAVAGGFRASMR